MIIKRILAVALAVFTAAIIYASDENQSGKINSASVKMQYSYMLNVIKTNIENDPESPFSVYAENEIRAGADASELYSELIAPYGKTDDTPEARKADTKGAGFFVCRSGAKREAESFDGSVFLYGDNYYIMCDKDGVALVLRSPRGMIKGEAKGASERIPEEDKAIRSVPSDGAMTHLVVRVGAAGGAEALCVVDPELSSPLLYDFSAFRT